MTKIPLTCDVLICGGAITGSSIAWFLVNNSDFDGKIVVVERDPTYRLAATALSASGIRHQFSSNLNIQIGQFGADFIRSSQKHFGMSLNFQENGYLYLAENSLQAKQLENNWRIQRDLGASTMLLSSSELVQRYPHLNVANVVLGSLGLSGEGWFDNMGLLNCFRSEARANGVQYLTGEVTGLKVQDNRITSVALSNGNEIHCGRFVNASGVRAREISGLAGLSVPIQPRKRTNFVFACAEKIPASLPLMIEPNGVWCRPEGDKFLCGCTPTNDPAVSPDDFEPNYTEFDDIIWPTLAARSRLFESIKLQRFWAGLYDMNTFDQNAIVGPAPDVENFFFANGFSGHGLQQSPAIGRGLSELITYGQYRSLDLRPLGFDRILENSPNFEGNII